VSFLEQIGQEGGGGAEHHKNLSIFETEKSSLLTLLILSTSKDHNEKCFKVLFPIGLLGYVAQGNTPPRKYCIYEFPAYSFTECFFDDPTRICCSFE